MRTYEELLAIINKELDDYKIDSSPSELYEPINYILSLGGKRLRPALTLMGCQIYNPDITDAVKPALAMEVFHNFTLMHDDIMDDAPLRRGQATVHEKWDLSTAILSGDIMLVKAYDLLMDVDDSKLRRVLEVFNQTAARVCEGQQYDMNFENQKKVRLNDYIYMITLKTAVLLGGSLQIGALIGGADEKDAKALYEFGKNMGIGFQLMDDILDVYGDVDKFGKQVGGDIIANKKTYLLIKALETADKETKQELKHWIKVKDFDKKEKVKAVKKIYSKLGIKKAALAEMNSFFNLAEKSLLNVSSSIESKVVLTELAEKLKVRLT